MVVSRVFFLILGTEESSKTSIAALACTVTQKIKDPQAKHFSFGNSVPDISGSA